MFEGAVYCPKCGARRARSDADDAKVRCPGCTSAPQRLHVGATTLLECAKCDGIWVDADVFEDLCADQEAQAAVLHRFGARTAAAAERIKYRPCARCGKMMNRVNFGRLSGIVVDVCKGHGTYLDPGELHRIVEFIRSGGLERARSRQLEELREQERSLREAESRLARDRGRADSRGSTRRFEAWTFMIGDD
jgi:Zn-finger nucleic acid-binding protein